MGLYVMSITEMGHCRRMENGSADSCLSVLDDQENGLLERENMIGIKDDKEKKVGFSLYSSSSESSIGKNSDEDLENVNGEEEEEVESKFNQGKDGAFNCLQALDEALPLNRGLSNYYDGMSKSYPRLDEAEASASSSIKAIAKPENMYSRKRKISLAMEGWGSGGESKKSASSLLKKSTSTVAMKNYPKSSDMRGNPYSEPTFSSLSPPHYSQISQTKFNSSCHTFSFADSEQCASLEASAPL